MAIGIQPTSAPRAVPAPALPASRRPSWLDARAGDGRALESIVRQESSRVSGMLVQLLGPRADLEDLAQTVFLELCRALPGFRGDSSLSTFIGGITIRVARRARRPSPWWFRRSERDLDDEPSTADPGPEAAATVGEQTRRLHRALGRLSDKKREAFVLWALGGHEVEVVAAMTGAGVAATRSRIYYAQKELRDMATRDPYLQELVGESPMSAASATASTGEARRGDGTG